MIDDCNEIRLYGALTLRANTWQERLIDHFMEEPPQAVPVAALTIQVVLPKHTPMVDVADALTRLATAVKGTWRHDPASGAFIVEGQP